MQTFILILSRLVPLSFLVSLTLVGSRYLHDLVLRGHPRLARWAFAGVSLVGLIAALPYTIRAGLIVGAQYAMIHGRWQAADLLYADYDGWNGLKSDEMVRRWANARMNAGNWPGAEEVLRMGEEPSPQTRVLIGLCQYYQSNPAAEATLRTVPDMTATQLCLRDYLLGRIAQKRGDLGGAYLFYARSARWEANFFPSVYHGVRLSLVHGDPQRAAAILDGFTRQFPRQESASDVLTLRDAIARHSVPPDKEFIIVSS
jgi:hypothetical protein